MTKKWAVVRHVEHEGIGTLAEVLSAFGISFHYVDIFRGNRLPRKAADAGGLIFMGGPMGVYEKDRYPFLAEEEELIRGAAEAGVPVVGICLGSQLIASALGASVFPGPHKEIGWFPVETAAADDPTMTTLPAKFMAFHWHGDTFGLPHGARLLFRSDLYPHQAFRWGNKVLGVQFHFEINAEMIHEWLQDPVCQAELAGQPAGAEEKIRRDTMVHALPLQTFSRIFFTQAIREMTQ